MNTSFNSKETYLAYRSEWKANYKNLSQEIRELRNEIKETQRAKGYTGSMQYTLFKLRAKATAMIEERKASKVEAQRQYLAAQESELVMA
jgi:hypothetical protein